MPTKELPKSTYQEQVDEFVKQIYRHYQVAGSMRDYASGREKDVFNFLRGKLEELESALRGFSQTLPDDRGTMTMTDFFPIKFDDYGNR